MCGIAGLLAFGPGDKCDLVSQATLSAMASLLAHRGPDAEGFWIDDAGRVGLAHRRLAILDLSAAGAQPMQSVDGRYVVVFNGEIYNHIALRSELEQLQGPIAWRGHSDTETLLAAISRWGLDEALRRCCGMFAIALWDTTVRSLLLARDRMGEKPLYIADLDHGRAFMSELKALRVVPGFRGAIDPDATSAYLAHAVVPDDRSIYKGVRKVRPGSIVSINAADGRCTERMYEDRTSLIMSARAQALRVASASETIERVLREVVASQMISDVPLGAFLSGGVDSSLVTALMQEVSERPVRSFSIGFDDLGYDESAHAERVARHLGTEHKTYRLREEDALAVIHELPRIYCEPFADSSQIPTLLLCRMARQDVSVALTGDGGDEVFGGYNRYTLAPKLWSFMSRLPRSLRRSGRHVHAVLRILGGTRSPALRRLIGLARLAPSTIDKAGRFAAIAARASSIEDVYRGLTRNVDIPTNLLVMRGQQGATEVGADLDGLGPEEWMMAMDTLTYLPSDILVKVDRAAMSASLETRAPFLDRRTVAAGWSLPIEARVRDGVGKCVLRDTLGRRVPSALTERPKQGFSVPIDSWLRGPLRDWAEDLLAADRLHEGGVLEPHAVRGLWSDHRSARANHGPLLWSILMLQAWLEETAPVAVASPSAALPATAAL